MQTLGLINEVIYTISTQNLQPFLHNFSRQPFSLVNDRSLFYTISMQYIHTHYLHDIYTTSSQYIYRGYRHLTSVAWPRQ